ncbi:MAG: phosphomethylpyrimidine kinase [Methanoregula sp.]|nr:MAG: phosphomethylpyrimidine kinase [Methanoregula sp.]
MKSPEQERQEVIIRLAEAVNLLSASMDIRFIPSFGVNIAYAIRGARDGYDVAAVQGGLHQEGGIIHSSGSCAFGTDEPITRVVLTITKFDPAMRSASVIAYHADFLEALEDMFIECCRIDVMRAAPQTSTMDWGIASCCSDGVPEVIYDKGTDEKEGGIYLIGEDAVEVANNIIILSHRIQ